MSEMLALEIKQQPFEPPFVLRIDGEELDTHVGKLDDDHVIAQIDGRGTYRINTADVGFFFVEKTAEPYKGTKAPRALSGGIVNRALRAAAESLGGHCGDVVSECQYVRSALSAVLMLNKRGEGV